MGGRGNTYVHLVAADVPIALADLHRSLRAGAPVELTFFAGDVEGFEVFPDDDLPGRWFSTWRRQRLLDVINGAGFTLDELEDHQGSEPRFTVRARRERTLPDTVGPGMRLLVCGLNPSLHAADAGVGFVTPGNRFWPAALAAGLVTRDRDPRHALLAPRRRHDRPREAGHPAGRRAHPRRVPRRRSNGSTGSCAWLEPAAVCFVGLAGWRAAVDRKAEAGWQERPARRPARLRHAQHQRPQRRAPASPTLVDHLRAAATG